MPSTAKRLSFFTESVIREMTRVANRHNAINLSQGFPDADPPPVVLAAGQQAMAQGPHQYSITWGAKPFRDALAQKQKHWMGLDLDPEAHIVYFASSGNHLFTTDYIAEPPTGHVVSLGQGTAGNGALEHFRQGRHVMMTMGGVNDMLVHFVGDDESIEFGGQFSNVFKLFKGKDLAGGIGRIAQYDRFRLLLKRSFECMRVEIKAGGMQRHVNRLCAA